MSILAELLDQVLAAATFRTRGGKLYTPDELRDAITLTQWGVPDSLDVLSARPEVDDQIVSEIVDHLRHALSEYIDAAADRIGHSFHIVDSIDRMVEITSDYSHEVHSSSSTSGFARGLVRAAAVLGIDRATKLVTSWATGKSRYHKICVVLAGVSIDQDIKLEHGLRIYRLPISSDSLPISMPNIRFNAVEEILGHPVLEIGASTHPALFAPPGDDIEDIRLETHTALGEVSLNTFFLALSLVCNQQVGLAWNWSDYDEAGTFADGARSSMGGPGMPLKRLSRSYNRKLLTGITELTSFDPPVPNLSEEGLRRAFDLRDELGRRIDSDHRFQIAVTRWARAASPGVINADRIVDLRIALEALYLDSDQGELGFRLSVTGARHLASNLEDRKDIRKALIEFYRLASRVIHGTSPRGSNEVLIVDAAAKLCRDGILKILEDRHRPDWTDFLLS